MPTMQERKARRRRYGTWLIGTLIVLGACLLLAGRFISTRLEREVVARLSTLLDAEVALDDLEIDVLPPGLELRGLSAIRDSERIVEAAVVDLRIDGSALLEGRAVLRSVVIERPFLALGDGGLTGSASSESAAQDSEFDLEIHQLRISDATIAWSSPQLKLTVKGAQVNTPRFLASDPEPLSLTALLDVGGPTLAPLEDMDLDLRASWDGSTLVLSELKIHSATAGSILGSGQVEAAGQDGGVVWSAAVDADLSVERLLPGGTLPWDSTLSGRTRVKAHVAGSDTSWSAKADIASAAVEWTVPDAETWTGRDLVARLEASANGPTTLTANASFAGGSARIRAGLPHAPGAQSLDVSLAVEGLRPEEVPGLMALAGMPDAPPVTLTGTLSAVVPLDDVQSTIAQVELTARSDDRSDSASQLDLSANADAKGLTVRRALLVTPTFRAEADGALGWDGASSLAIGLDVASLQATLETWPGSPPAAALEPHQLDGHLLFAGRLTGTPSAPSLSGEIEVKGLTIDRFVAGDLQARVEADGEALLMRAGALTGPNVDLNFEAGLPWGDTARAHARIDVERLPLGLLAALHGDGHELTGVASGRVVVEPRGGSTGFDLELRTSLAAVGDLEISDLVVAASYDAGLLEIREAVARVADGELSANGSLGTGLDQHSVRVQATGLDLAKLLPDEQQVAGRLSVEATLSGEPQAPRPAGPAEWAVTGLTVQGHELGDAQGILSASGRGYDISLNGLRGDLTGSVQLVLDPAPSIDANIELKALDLDLGDDATDLLSFRSQGLKLRLTGSPTVFTNLEHQLSIDMITLDGRGISVSTPEGLALRGLGSQVHADGLRLTLNGTELILGGHVDLANPRDHLLRARGELALSLLETWLPEVDLNGTAQLDLTSKGTDSEPELLGKLSIRDAYLRALAFPHALEDLSVDATFTGTQLLVNRATATLGGGELRGDGFVELTGLIPTQHRIALVGEDVQLRSRNGLTSTSDFSLALAGDSEQSLLSGKVDVQALRYTKDVRLEQTLASPGTAPPASTVPSPLDRIRLDLAVSAESDIHVDNDLAAVELMADLEVVGTASRPILVGVTRTVNEGRLTFQRARYRVSQGTVLFSLAHPNDPQLDVIAETRLAEHDIELRLTGRVSDPQIALSSVPPLGTERIVALLATGGAVGAGSGEFVPAGLAADFLKGRMSKVDAAMKKVTGLDVFAFDPALGQGQGDHLARLTVGKKLTKDVTAIVSTDLGGDSSSAASLTWKATDELSVRAGREASGTNALSMMWTRARRPPVPLERVPHEPFVLGSVALEGLPDSGDPSLTLALGLRSGEETSERGLRRAASSLRTALQESGHALARVRCKKSAEGSNQGVVDVRCEVVRGPRTELELVGVEGKLETRLRTTVTEEWWELFQVRDLADETLRVCTDVLKEQGHANANVQIRETSTPDLHVVTATIDAGPRMRVASFEFPTSDSLPNRRLVSAARAVAPAGLRGPLLTPTLLEDVASAVTGLYRSEGWMEAAVQPFAHETIGEAKVKVSIPVIEGSLYRLQSFALDGDFHLPHTSLLAEFEAAVGKPLRPQVLDATCQGLVAEYDEKGHPEATALWSWREEGGGAAVVLRIDEGPHFSMGDVRIVGAVRTNERFIRQLAKLEPGDPFSREQLGRASRRLQETGLFERVTVRGMPSPAVAGVRPVTIELTESDPLRLSVGLGLDDREGAHSTFSVSHANRGGRGRSVATNFRLGAIERHGELALRARSFRGSDTDLLGSAGLRQQEEPGFIIQTLGLGIEAARPTPWKGRTSWSLRLEDTSLREVRLSEVESDLDEGLFAEVGIGLTNDTRNSALSPSDGALSTARLSLGAGLDGSRPRHVRLFARHTTFHQVSPRTLLSSGIRLGTGWPISGSRLPLGERFRAGGATTIRGFRRDSLGPRDSVTNHAVGGEALLILNNELSLSFGARLSGHLFLDAGNVYEDVKELTKLDLRTSSGVGLGLQTPFGPIRFYHAWVLDPRPGESSGRFHFAISSTF